MCLATAFKFSEGKMIKLCENITRIEINEENIILIDVLNMSMKITGKLKSIDLKDSVITIED